MKLILLVLFALACGYGLLQIDQIDPNNYVKLYFGNYMVEIKLLGFLLLLIVSVIVLYVLLRLFRLLWKSPNSWSNWRNRCNKSKSEASLGEGYLSLIKGDWHKAETQLTTKTQYSGVPYVNYLAAAQAAQEQGRIQQRDEYLQQAYNAAPKQRLAIGMIKAKLHQSASQYQEALATLNDVADEGKKNPQFIAMLIQSYQELDDWQQIQNLLPTARKHQALSSELLEKLQNDMDVNMLTVTEDKQVAWRSLSRQQKKQLQNIELYSAYLMNDKQFVDAEKLIRATLKQHWSDTLVNLYGQIETEKPAKLLRSVEGWLLARPENAQLLLAAGRLAYAGKQLDTAKEYLQQAIVKAQLPEAFSLLGKLYEHNNETGKALELYRSGMQQLANSADVKLMVGHDKPVESSLTSSASDQASGDDGVQADKLAS